MSFKKITLTGSNLVCSARYLENCFCKRLKIPFRHMTKNTFLNTCGILLGIKHRLSIRRFDHLMGFNPQ